MTAGNGPRMKSTKFCFTVCAITSASANAVEKPCRRITGGTFATLVFGKRNPPQTVPVGLPAIGAGKFDIEQFNRTLFLSDERMVL